MAGGDKKRSASVNYRMIHSGSLLRSTEGTMIAQNVVLVRILKLLLIFLKVLVFFFYKK